jgi:spore coat-associated protein N
VTARPLLAVAAITLAALATLPREHSELVLTAGGALRLDNSRDGAAVLSAPNLRPGDSVTGSVTVANRGDSAVRLRLQSSPPRGGALAEVLEVTVGGVGGGTLEALAGCHDLGSLQAGAARTYRFTARVPRAVGNRYAGSSASADERWTAGAGCEPPVRVRLSHRHVRLVGGRARLGVRCSGPCHGTATLAPRSWRSRRIFVARAARFDGGGAVDVAVPPESQALIRRRGKAVAVATLRGTWGTKRRLVTLIARSR